MRGMEIYVVIFIQVFKDFNVGWPEIKGVFATFDEAYDRVPGGYEIRSKWNYYKNGVGHYLIRRRKLGR
jgi:hypothetical protein